MGCFLPTLSFLRHSGSAYSTVPGSWGCLSQARVQIQRAFCSWEGRERTLPGHRSAAQVGWQPSWGAARVPPWPSPRVPKFEGHWGRYQCRRAPLGWTHWDLESGGSRQPDSVPSVVSCALVRRSRPGRPGNARPVWSCSSVPGGGVQGAWGN